MSNLILFFPFFITIILERHAVFVNQKLVYRFKKISYLKFILELIKSRSLRYHKDKFFFFLKFKQYFITLIVTLFIESFFIVLTNSYELSVILTTVFFIVFYFINYQKCRTLKEPLVWSDICLIKEVFLCPKFYLAYVPKVTYFYLLIVLSVFISFLYYLPKHKVDTTLWWSALFSLVIITAFFISNFYRNYKVFDCYLSYDSLIDGLNLGVILSLIYEILILNNRGYKLYLKNFLKNHNEKHDISTNNKSNTNKVVLMQAESFCSLKRLQFEKDPFLFENHKDLSCRWVLNVPYLGAYTMRTEFSVLTGINLRDLKVFSYDPYLLAKKIPITSLATLYKRLGFTNICVHPNFKEFFSRNKVMQNFDFDLFLSKKELQESLVQQGRTTKSIDDATLLKLVSDVIIKDYKDKKVFVFIITMGSHGPWQTSYLKKTKNFDELALYKEKINILSNASVSLLDNCSKEDCPISLVLYGDHLPVIEKLYSSKEHLMPDVLIYNVPNLKGKTNIISSNTLHNLVLKVVS